MSEEIRGGCDDVMDWLETERNGEVYKKTNSKNLDYSMTVQKYKKTSILGITIFLWTNLRLHESTETD